MQEGCDTIYPANIHNTVHGKDASKAAEESNSTYMGEVFGPTLRRKPGKNIKLFFFKKFHSSLTNGMIVK